jgi:hypothetical protein
MTDFSPTHACISHANSMDHRTRIQAAITDLKSQDRRNTTATAKKWGIIRKKLLKRF